MTVENIRGRISEPSRCPRNDCNTIGSMEIIHNRCIFSDKQLIKLQETPGKIVNINRNYSAWTNTAFCHNVCLR